MLQLACVFPPSSLQAYPYQNIEKMSVESNSCREILRLQRTDALLANFTSIRDKEELAFAIISSLPFSSIAALQRRIAPLLRFDLVGLLPYEVALHILSFLPSESLLTCSLVSRSWRVLAEDQSLWKALCSQRDWEWRTSSSSPRMPDTAYTYPISGDSDDEGMGAEEDSEAVFDSEGGEDSGFASMMVDGFNEAQDYTTITHPSPACSHEAQLRPMSRTQQPEHVVKVDYKLLHRTQTRLHNRMLHGSYMLYTFPMSGVTNGHTNTIYCLQLYTYPDTGVQVLFTGSKDRSIREWDLTTGQVIRVIEDAHGSSVLSICVHDGIIASGGSDWQVAIWDLPTGSLIKSLRDHEDSVLCVRFDDKRLVSCSKDKTVRTYLMPDMAPEHVLQGHRAAVNAVSIASNQIISASGDRTIRLWDADSGALLRTFEQHHGRGIAATDFKPPYVISGSSDKHLRLLDLSTTKGWSTATNSARSHSRSSNTLCSACGEGIRGSPNGDLEPCNRPRTHRDLVRSVAMSVDLVVSGSYDHTVKVWNRTSGTLIADLTGGHVGRVFCVGLDCTKIVSCGEDQRICIWDFSHGMDTSFIKL
ncbi:uncharacterized protein FIBRA_06896 [Fibroporia radiculosa]|uniref:F-box domain-containing protein n=1 Tax=Fibroporia radiculosa TaxID=599839 RepID=J4H4B6_9APHY|nr:uncharacterized protein FIBRA_06896 [Fibroporia radiculosa]CCM04709.1 predicted protein [Fibroporia radiculosa]